MDLGGGGNGGGVSGMMPDERKGGGGRLDFASNGQTAGYHNNSQAYGVGQTFRMPDGKVVEIRNVWADNLEREMRVIRDLIERYPFVAMDTEFPGVVARPVGDFNQPDYQYQTLRCNVDLLKIIQLGLSFANERGELPDIGCCTWQFNFVFNLSEDMYAHDSIQLLKNSGIDFEAHERRGIDLQHFGELLMTSGLVLMPNVTWLSFHSGYDFGYLLKLLTCDNLPQQESEFFDLLQLYFPKIYDIKFLVSSQNGFHGGLNKLAEELKIERIGPIHQAGSDSLLTEQVFLKVSDVFFNGVENLDKGKFKGKFVGQLYGYGGNQTGIFRPGNKTGHHNNGGGSGASSGVGGGNGTNSAAALVTAAVANSNNNGSSNNSSASNGNNNMNNGTAVGQQGATAGVAPPGNDANSSATDAATGASGVPASSVSGSAAVNPPTAGETAGVSGTNTGVSHDAGGVTSGPAIGDPSNASAGSSNSAATGTGVAAAGDANSAQDESTAGGGTEGPPGVPGNGAGAPVS